MSFSDNKTFVNTAILELEKKLSSVTANISCQTRHNSSYQSGFQQPLLQQQYPPNKHYQSQKQPIVNNRSHVSRSHHQPNYHHQQSYPPTKNAGSCYISEPAQHHPQPSSSSLASILQVIRAERESAEKRRELSVRSTSLDRFTSPIAVPQHKSSTTRRIQRHPPVSYPKKPLVTQRLPGSPPSPNISSSYSPSSSNSYCPQPPTPPSAFAVASGPQPIRRPTHKSSLKRNDTFLRTRSKTIADFFGTESTPVSRLLNIICQEKAAEKAQAIMSSSRGKTTSSSSGKPNTTTASRSTNPGRDGVLSKISTVSASSSSASTSSLASSSGTRAVRSRKENVIPVAQTNSSSSVNSGSGGGGGVGAQLFATKDIDRIAKYKADRRKPIYLRNTVQENENERLERKKR